MYRTVVGLLERGKDVEDSIGVLRDEGYRLTDISIVMKDDKKTAADRAGERTISGEIAKDLAEIEIPDFGNVLACGPVVAALGVWGPMATAVSDTTSEALKEGLAGSLTKLGLSEDDSEYYQARIDQGSTLLALPARDSQDVTEVASILEDFGATDIKTMSKADYYDEQLGLYSSHQREKGFALYGVKGGQTRKSGKTKMHGIGRRHKKAM